MSNLTKKMVESHPKLKRGKVWCMTCGRCQSVNSAWCIWAGWPECCGYTMTLDSPEERIALNANTE